MCSLSLVFWVALVASVLWVIFRNRPDAWEQVSSLFADPRSRADPADEILRGRVARGEIGAEEYERSAEVLRST